MTYEEEIIATVKQLAPEKQRRVLEFVRQLTVPSGETGKDLVATARKIGFGSKDLREMQQAIEEERARNQSFPEVDLDA